jgi:hypothetical protein
MRPGRIVVRCDSIASVWWVNWIADTLVDELLTGDALVGMAGEARGVELLVNGMSPGLCVGRLESSLLMWLSPESRRLGSITISPVSC